MEQTIGDLVAELERRLDGGDLYFGHGTDNPFDEAAWIAAHAAGIDLALVDDLPWDQVLDESQRRAAHELLEARLSTGEPLAYLINEAWFAGRKFYVDSRAIVPRSHLGEPVVERFEPWILPGRVNEILDLCTGSGCIAVSLALSFPDANVTASDLSAQALEVASRNVADYELEPRIRLVQGDLFSGLIGARFDLIVCNPPYVSDRLMADLPKEYRHEPEMAFAGGAEGLDLIERILRESRQYLNPGGVLVVEAGSAGSALEARYPGVSFTWLASDTDEPLVFLITREELVGYLGDPVVPEGGSSN